jgi:hypothetical protein
MYTVDSVHVVNIEYQIHGGIRNCLLIFINPSKE